MPSPHNTSVDSGGAEVVSSGGAEADVVRRIYREYDGVHQAYDTTAGEVSHERARRARRRQNHLLAA